MDIVADILIFRHGEQHFISDVLWMRGGEPYTKQGRNVSYSFQQFCKRYCLVFSAGIIIRVYILSKQHYFAISILKKFPAFPHNAVCIATSFAATGKGHHAERAHIVAAPHDAYKSCNAITIETYGRNVRVSFIAAE